MTPSEMRRPAARKGEPGPRRRSEPATPLPSRAASASAPARPAHDGTSARIQRALGMARLFDRASRASREAAAAAGVLEVVPGGSVVIHQGGPPDGLVVIGRGRARVDRTSADGRVVPLGYRGAGEVLGASCLGRPPVHTESATAMEELECVRLPLAIVEALIVDDPEIGPAVLSLLLGRQREVE